MVRAVLFDLDDTLFDHRLCARTALAELHRAHAPFQARPFPEFERMHAAFLEELHRRVMTGELELEAARRERFRRLFQAVDAVVNEDTIENAAVTYRDGYRKVRQPIAGAAALLAAIKPRARVGIVSNNLLEEQQDKLRHCGLDELIDALVVSEEAGVSKPDPAIFRIALDRLGCRADQAVMLGDSWAADIIGALSAEIRAIWFNPLGKPSPDPSAGVPELRTLDAVEALPLIFGQGEATDPDRQTLGSACE
jgi:HAD superfamily hydrolase (TIGR01549 family)